MSRTGDNGRARGPAADLYDALTERRVMGTTIIDRGALQIATERLGPDALQGEHYRTILAAAAGLASETPDDQPIDAIELARRVADSLHLDDGAAQEFLANIVGPLGSGHALPAMQAHAFAAGVAELNRLAGLRAAARLIDNTQRAIESGRGSADALRAARDGLSAIDLDSGSIARSRPLVRSVADIAPEAVSWVWPSRIEAGTLTTIGGDPATAKSILLCAVAAAVSRGARWPDTPHNWVQEPRSVIILSAEDSASRTLRPRLAAAGADLARVHLLEGVREEGADRPFSLQRDLPVLEHLIAATGAALVAFDPIDSYLPNVETNSSTDIRAILEPLSTLCEHTGAAAILVKHLNKKPGVAGLPALYRISGTIAFAGLSRCVHVVAVDPEDKARRLFAPVKINNAMRPDPLRFTIGTVDGAPVVEWLTGVVDTDADAALGPPQRPERALSRAAEWLGERLRDGAAMSVDLEGEAEAVGIAAGTLKRAKERLNVVAEQVREEGRLIGWRVALPEGAQCSPKRVL